MLFRGGFFDISICYGAGFYVGNFIDRLTIDNRITL